MRALLALSYLGFISLGLPDSILGAAWPVMRVALGMPVDAAGPLLLLSTCGVVISGASSGRLLARLPTSVVLIGSTAAAALALLGFALAPSWWFMLGAALMAGMGGGAIDAALNGFVARHYDVRHMNWLHGCWGIGAMMGPAILAVLLAAGHSWRLTYALLAIVELAMAASFAATARRWPAPAPVSARPEVPRLTGEMRTRVAFFFLYGGIESAAGLWGPSFLIEQKGAKPALASAVIGAYWGGLMLGRFVLGALTTVVGHQRLIRLSLRIALVALIVLALPPVPLALAATAFACLGFAFSAIYPSVMHETPRRFGDAVAAHLVGYQVAAASAGVATIPWLLGIAARASSLKIIPIALLALTVGLVTLETRRR
jgi:fucose permease